MEHILQFGVNIDDDAIVRTITAKAENIIIDSIKRRAEKNIDEVIYNKGYRYNDSDKLRPWIQDEFIKFLESHKDDIIERASEKLADKMIRTKQVKEAVSDVLKEFDN